MICFAWSGFPQYAARCVGALVKAIDEQVVVVATRPSVPVEGMERLSRCRVVWLEASDERPLRDVLGENPSVLFTSGWAVKLFNRYRDEVRTHGGRVIAMSDNNCRFSLREVVKAIRFRLFLRNKYDGFFVAGVSCARLLRFYGVPKSKIQIGMYSADSSIFNDRGVPICNRPKKIIFVGQLCERKNPIRLCQAFRLAKGFEHGWSLELYGCGPLQNKIPQGNGVFVHGFLQPEELAAKYRESRIFCLPSLEEHWGLVVHEAALSGCVLLLSDAIGAKDDFVGKENGFLFGATDEKAFARTMARAMALDDAALCRASRESLEKGRQISLDCFVKGVKYFA